ncbi:dimethylsulfonioproprionate lyase family protein [Rubrivivax gelatinosus]
MTAPHPLAGVLALMREHFAAGARSGHDEVAALSAQVLRELPDTAAPLDRPLQGSRHALLAQVPEAARAAGAAWEAALLPLASQLPWRYSYAARRDAPGLEDRMAWAELVGPAAPIHSERVGFGLTFLTRETFYPPHRHPAVELYAVVSGTSQWTLEGRTRLCQAGDFVLHPADAVHAMRSLGTPLLAIYSWTGDIVSPTAYV